MVSLIQRIKNIGTTIKTLPTKFKDFGKNLKNIPSTVGTFVTNGISKATGGIKDMVDNVKDLPKTIMTGIEKGLTKPDGILDRVGLVDDDGELRNFNDIREASVKSTNKNILKAGDWGKEKVEVVRDKVGTAWHTGTVATAKFFKDAGRFIIDGQKKVSVLASDFAKKVIKAQLESSGVGPFVKKHWVKFGLGASAIGGAYMFATAGMPILSVKTSLGTVTKLPKLVQSVERVSEMVEGKGNNSGGTSKPVKPAGLFNQMKRFM